MAEQIDACNRMNPRRNSREVQVFDSHRPDAWSRRSMKGIKYIFIAGILWYLFWGVMMFRDRDRTYVDNYALHASHLLTEVTGSAESAESARRLIQKNEELVGENIAYYFIISQQRENPENWCLLAKPKATEAYMGNILEKILLLNFRKKNYTHMISVTSAVHNRLSGIDHPVWSRYTDPSKLEKLESTDDVFSFWLNVPGDDL